MALNGPEILLQALGINTKELEKAMTTTVREIHEIHAFMVTINQRMDRIEKALGVQDPQSMSQPTPEQLRLTGHG